MCAVECRRMQILRMPDDDHDKQNNIDQHHPRKAEIGTFFNQTMVAIVLINFPAAPDKMHTLIRISVFASLDDNLRVFYTNAAYRVELCGRAREHRFYVFE